MSRGKHTRLWAGKGVGIKALVLMASIALVLCGLIGGTVAWLITETAPVKNTFTYGDINITLEETDTGLDDDGDPDTNTYQMVPGNPITKDPKVTVKADSENCWLFVKLEKSGDPAAFDTFMEYEMADGWIALDGVDNVYYREVYKEAVDQSCYVIKNNTVSVKSTVTKADLNALTTYPTLTVTAYAVQRDSNITTAAAAWALATGG